MPLCINPATSSFMADARFSLVRKPPLSKTNKGQIVGYLSSVFPVLSHRSHWVCFCVSGSKGY